MKVPKIGRCYICTSTCYISTRSKMKDTLILYHNNHVKIISLGFSKALKNLSYENCTKFVFSFTPIIIGNKL